MGQVFGGRYELVDQIGHGGSGSVWRIWDRREGSYRAAKLLTQSDSVSLLRFIRETGHRVNHPHVLPPTGWIGEDDRVLLLMDLVTGGSLDTVLADYGPLPDWFAMVVTDQLLDALETIHRNNLIHRDIKPGNMLFEVTGTAMPVVRLSDFGIAARTNDARLTHTAEVVGTHGYMSPLARMGVEPEPAQDLYATAMVLGQMLTGARPTETDEPIDLRQVPGGLADFVARLAAESGHGFASATEARAALRTLQATTNPDTDPIEIFDQVGPLPEGWTETGKVDRPTGDEFAAQQQPGGRQGGQQGAQQAEWAQSDGGVPAGWTGAADGSAPSSGPQGSSAPQGPAPSQPQQGPTTFRQPGAGPGALGTLAPAEVGDPPAARRGMTLPIVLGAVGVVLLIAAAVLALS